MLVCHCKVVNDRTVREAIRSGARTPRQVALACNAGRRCGGCRPLICELIAAEGGETGADAPELPVVAAG